MVEFAPGQSATSLSSSLKTLLYLVLEEEERLRCPLWGGTERAAASREGNLRYACVGRRQSSSGV